jgi:hypothetical protein
VKRLSEAVLYDSHEIKQIQSRTANPSRFTVLDQKIRRLAKAVEQNWDNFEAVDRELLQNLAYDLIRPKKGISKIWSSIWAGTYIAFIVTTTQLESFNSCLEALDILIDNILNAIEHDDIAYKQFFFDTLEELKLHPGVISK